MGFEPTVGFPTLDFESSALNRTQPPFQSLDIVDLISGCAIFSPAVCLQRQHASSWRDDIHLPRRIETRIIYEFKRRSATSSVTLRLWRRRRSSRPNNRSQGQKMLQFWACHAFPWGCILYVPRTANAITCCSPGFTSCLRRCSQVFASY